MAKTKTGKTPAVVATSTVTSLMLLGSIGAAPTTTASQYLAPNEPAAMIRYLNEGFDFSTSTATMKSYEQITLPINAFAAASDMFGPMRNSTKEEASLFEAMLESKSTPVGINIFSL